PWWHNPREWESQTDTKSSFTEGCDAVAPCPGVHHRVPKDLGPDFSEDLVERRGRRKDEPIYPFTARTWTGFVDEVVDVVVAVESVDLGNEGRGAFERWGSVSRRLEFKVGVLLQIWWAGR